MTNFWKLIGTAAVAVSVLAACDDGTITPVAPELGEIAVSQDKIGVGHQIVLTVQDKTPVVGNLYSIDPVWTVNGSEIMDIYTSYEYVGGIGRYTCYYVPMNTGVLDVSLSVDMRFNDAPVGEEEKSVSVSRQLEVEPCDARNSFWGDSVAITVYREPGLGRHGSEDEYTGPGLSSIAGITNYDINSVNLTYRFNGGELYEISEVFALSTATGGYGYIAEVFDFALKTLETEFAGSSIAGRSVEPLDTQKTDCIDVANKYSRGEVLTTEESALLGEGIIRGWVRIASAMSTENTSIRFTTGATELQPNGGTVNVVLTYSEK